MIKTFFTSIKSIDKSIAKTMFLGFNISLVILLLSVYILTLYKEYPFSHIAYLSGLNVFKLSLTCLASVFVCGIAIDKIKNQKI